MTIHLIRHGLREDLVRPEWKLDAGRPFDPPLSLEGMRQAEDVARALEGTGVRALYSSPFLRALQTAAASSALLNLPVRIEPGLGEFLNPLWFPELPQMLPLDQIRDHCPMVDAAYEPVCPRMEFEAAEAVDVRRRVTQTLQGILRRHPGESFAAFTHGSPLCQAASVLAGTLDGVDTGMGSITCVAGDSGTFRLLQSSSSHLQDQDTIRRFH